jgi:predicted small secreted protein
MRIVQHRPSGLVVVLVVAAVMLTGCGGVRGNDAATVAHSIDRVPGVSGVTINRREISETFGSLSIVIVDARVVGGHDDVGGVQLARYLLAAAYSVHNWKPTAGVRIVLHGYDGTSLGRALQDAGWDGVVWEPSDPGRVFVNGKVLENEFGRWPGTTPTPPAPCRQATVASANGSTAEAPARLSSRPATVIVQRLSTRSSTSSTGPSWDCSAAPSSGPTVKVSQTPLNR